ncbi:MAG TPA: class I SAM-dependent methyltransferase [Candidatus Binatia bacterium]|jgi:SAM-dependent methyltransferase|nr:class I SAM-dependent methyltransferase [Candidatus Binatia bacterium]
MVPIDPSKAWVIFNRGDYIQFVQGTAFTDPLAVAQRLERETKEFWRCIALLPSVIGRYAYWLAGQGYTVHLIDGMPLHIAQAQRAAANGLHPPLASLAVGDARRVEVADASGDAVLLMGPLYHLTERDDRLATLGEARRILRQGGVVFAVGISRFTSALNGLVKGYWDDPVFVRIVQQDLMDGQHRNPTNHPAYFTTTFFHRPQELQEEIEEAGLRHEATLPVEGVAWLLGNFEEQWSDPGRRERLLTGIRWLEEEPSLLGASIHLMAIGRKGL